MSELSVSEILLYTGIALVCLAAVAAVLAVIIFRATGKKIRRVLEKEYGKCLK